MAAKPRDQAKFRKSYAQVHITTDQHSKFGTIPLSRFLKLVDEKKGGRKKKERKKKLQAALTGSSKSKYKGTGIHADAHATHTNFRAFVPG